MATQEKDLQQDQDGKPSIVSFGASIFLFIGKGEPTTEEAQS